MPRTVVIIEDDASVLELLCDVLQSEGVSAVGCAHPRNLERTLENIQPALFLIDVMLPKTDGVTLGRELRDNGYARTPMVAMSASVARLTLASRSGVFDDVMQKPFDVGQFMDLVHRYTVGVSRIGGAMAG